MKRILRAWRQLRSRWTDYRTGTVLLYGGPFEGERETLDWARHGAWVHRSIHGGRYFRRGRRLEWTQQFRVAEYTFWIDGEGELHWSDE